MENVVGGSVKCWGIVHELRVAPPVACTVDDDSGATLLSRRIGQLQQTLNTSLTELLETARVSESKEDKETSRSESPSAGNKRRRHTSAAGCDSGSGQISNEDEQLEV